MLDGPGGWERAGADQRVGRQIQRLASLKDGPRDLRGEESQPEARDKDVFVHISSWSAPA